MLLKQIIFLTLSLSCNLQFNAIGKNLTPDLKTIMSSSIPFREDGKIFIPSNIKHIKLDIGLSYSAPMAQYWLTHEDDLMVFGFEPNPESVKSILEGAVKRHESHGDPLDKRFIGKEFQLIPCALGLSNDSLIKFHVTSDCGCSSIYTPKYFAIDNIIEVPIFSLARFFDLFPFDTHPFIDYIKIDTQGSDLDIVKSGGKHIAEHIIFLTIEAENDQYENTHNSVLEIEHYMNSIGFQRYYCSETSDPTFINCRFEDYAKQAGVKIYQHG